MLDIERCMLGIERYMLGSGEMSGGGSGVRRGVDRGLVSLEAHRGPRGNATSWVTYLPLKKDLDGVQQQTFLRAPWSYLLQLCIKVMDHIYLGSPRLPLGRDCGHPLRN